MDDIVSLQRSTGTTGTTGTECLQEQEGYRNWKCRQDLYLASELPATQPNMK